MATIAVTVIGVDRPGIVAAVTKALVDWGCNLEDTSMSILRGHFAMVLIVAAPDDLDARSLELAVVEATAPLGLQVAVRTVGDAAGSGLQAGEAWTVVVYGADHPGIVHGITSVLAELGVNIVDLTTRVTGADPPVYSMVMEVSLPPGLSPAEMEVRLAREAEALGVDCSLHPSEPDIL